MALRRIFVDRVEGATAFARGARAHHLARAARLRPGEIVELSDGRRLYRAAVESADPAEVRFRVEGELEAVESAIRIEIQAALVKFARFEWMIEKATELGVAAIVPLDAERVERRAASLARKRLARWRRIAEEAAQQSRRLAPPELSEPLPFTEALARPGGLRILLDFEGCGLAQLLQKRRPTKESTVSFLVGPEGGWSDKERAAAREAGYEPARLGGGVLRAETAAVAAAAICASLEPRA